MIIQCTHCSAKFRIPDSKATKDEIKARCANCEQIFVAVKGRNAFEDSEASLPDSPPPSKKASMTSVQESILQDIEESKEAAPEDFEEPIFEKGEVDFSEDEANPQQEAPSAGSQDFFAQESDTQQKKLSDPQENLDERDTLDVEEEKKNSGSTPGSYLHGQKTLTKDDLSSGPSSAYDVSGKKAVARIPLVKAPAQKKPTRKLKAYSIAWYMYLLYPLAIVIAFMIGLSAVGISPSLKNVSLFQTKTGIPLKEGLLLSDVDSSDVSTLDGHEVFVIKGRIYNNTKESISGVVIEGELYAANKVFIRKEKFPCCLSLAPDSLKESSEPEVLYSAFEKEGKEQINPYSSLPFTLVFRKPEEKIYSFRVIIHNE